MAAAEAEERFHAGGAFHGGGGFVAGDARHSMRRPASTAQPRISGRILRPAAPPFVRATPCVTGTARSLRHARLPRGTNARRAALARNRAQQRTTALQARRGRFAAAYAARQRGRGYNGRRWWWARRAWRYGALAAFVPWYGPLFWPYAYADLFDYAFWPYGYYDGYWAYAYDGFFDGIFWGDNSPYLGYAYAAPTRHRGSRHYAAAPAATEQQVAQLCNQPGNGITAWPIAEIKRKVNLNADQRQLLEDLRAAGDNAAEAFKNSCPAQAAFPLTPPGRLQAMTARLQAIREAVTAVEPALDKFYASLSDEQKERFNEIGPQRGKDRAENAQASARTSADAAQSCKQPKPGLANLPIERIQAAVKPTDAQADGLKKLQDATDKAVTILANACPNETPLTPPGRMQAMDTRLKAMIDAANTVKGPLDDFYSSLNDEQKARFNRIGRDLAQASRND